MRADKNTQDLGKTLGKMGRGHRCPCVVAGAWALVAAGLLGLACRHAGTSAPVVFDDGSAKTAIGVLGVVNARRQLASRLASWWTALPSTNTCSTVTLTQRRGHFDDDDEVELLVPEATEPAKPSDKADPAKSEGPAGAQARRTRPQHPPVNKRAPEALPPSESWTQGLVQSLDAERLDDMNL